MRKLILLVLCYLLPSLSSFGGIKKQITLDTGVSANHYDIKEVHIYFDQKIIEFEVHLYKDKAAKISGKKPIKRYSEAIEFKTSPLSKAKIFTELKKLKRYSGA